MPSIEGPKKSVSEQKAAFSLLANKNSNISTNNNADLTIESRGVGSLYLNSSASVQILANDGIDINTNNGSINIGNLEDYGDINIGNSLTQRRVFLGAQTTNSTEIHLLTGENGVVEINTGGALNITTISGTTYNSDITVTGALNVSGVIESTSGGIKFPNGSVQTTAYPSGGLTLVSGSQRAALTPSIGTLVYQTDISGSDNEGIYVYKTDGWTFVA